MISSIIIIRNLKDGSKLREWTVQRILRGGLGFT